MKQLLLIISVISSTITWAASFEEANKLFQEKKYDQAITAFEVYLDDHNDIAGYYNLGLAYHETNAHGKAVWAFQKVLKLNPKDDAAWEQFKMCQNDIDPNKETKPILSSFESNLYSLSSTTWSILAMISAILLSSLLIATYKFTLKRKALGVSSVASSILLVLLIIIASKTNNFENHEYAIAVAETHVLDTETHNPTNKIILEGERFDLIERIDNNYLMVRDDLGVQEIVPAKDFKSI